MAPYSPTRLHFLKGTAASRALTTLDARAAGLRSPSKPYRVGLIGTGWYGKSDLFRLIQVSPVNVVALCDADQQMLAGAGKMVSQRQQSGKVPQLYSDYRKIGRAHV